MYASDEVSRVHVLGMHGSKAKGIDCDGFVTHCELECPSSLKNVHSNLKEISYQIKGFLFQIIFVSFKF
jgi:hypothetical protein